MLNSLRVVSANAPDVAVIGGGIVGCAVAAFAAEAGARVRLYEREHVAAGASGRNSGIVQHPLDAPLVGVYEATLDIYRELGHGFAFPAEAVGTLVLGEDPAQLEPSRAAIATAFPALGAEALAGEALRELEPELAGDLAGFRLETGHAVPPAAATEAFAARARAAGAEILEGVAGLPFVVGERVAGVRTEEGTAAAGAVVLAAGPWTGELACVPVSPLWGVNVVLRLARPPRHALEQAGVEDLLGERAPDSIFSLVTHAGASALGSTFEREQPDPGAHAEGLIERGARYVPAVASAPVASLRACARPQSADGRPFLGPGAADGLFLAAGHGPWGISLGPGSAKLVADAVLGLATPIAPELRATRPVAPA